MSIPYHKAAVDCWLEDFAYINKIHPAVCSFVEEHPEMLNTNVVDKLPNQLFMSQRALGDKGGVSDVLWDWDNGAIVTGKQIGRAHV